MVQATADYGSSFFILFFVPFFSEDVEQVDHTVTLQEDNLFVVMELALQTVSS